MTTTLDRSLDLPALDERGRRLMFTDARTANTFTDEPVTDAELASIWELAKWAPTAANTQPLRLLWVRTAEGKERLARHLDEANRAKTLAAPAVAVLAVDSRFHEHMDRVLPVKPGLREHFEANPDARDAITSYSGALQAGYLIMSIRAHGLAAGPMGGFDRDGVDHEFFTDGRWRSTLVVNVGHPGPDAWWPRQPRLEHDEVVAWV